MTLEEFKNIKIGDSCLIPSKHDGKPCFTSTEVLAKDDLFNKLTVLLGRKPYSYKYVRKNNGSQEVRQYVGTGKAWSPFFLY